MPSQSASREGGDVSSSMVAALAIATRVVSGAASPCAWARYRPEVLSHHPRGARSQPTPARTPRGPATRVLTHRGGQGGLNPGSGAGGPSLTPRLGVPLSIPSNADLDETVAIRAPARGVARHDDTAAERRVLMIQSREKRAPLR